MIPNRTSIESLFFIVWPLSNGSEETDDMWPWQTVPLQHDADTLTRSLTHRFQQINCLFPCCFQCFYFPCPVIRQDIPMFRFIYIYHMNLFCVSIHFEISSICLKSRNVTSNVLETPKSCSSLYQLSSTTYVRIVFRGTPTVSQPRFNISSILPRGPSPDILTTRIRHRTFP